MLGDDADEPLDGAEHHPVDHHGTMLLAVLAGVLQIEPLRQLGIQLDGAALPCTAKAVLNVEVQLRPVERAVALVDNEVLAHAGDGLLQNFLVGLPLLHGADVVFGHGGQLYGVFQAKHVVHLVEQADNVLNFALHLLPGHEDVGIVLGEAPDAEQAVERAGQLMTVHQTQFAHPQGQIAVGMRLTGVDQHTAGVVYILFL